jgi:spore photoproduct lyase
MWNPRLEVIASDEARQHERFDEVQRRVSRISAPQVATRNPDSVVTLQVEVNRGRFLKPCPGQKGNVCCGYWVVEWGMGCPFRCRYCVLQYYQNPGNVLWYLNWEQLIAEIEEARRQTIGIMRIGTGEFGDSLTLEEIFPLNGFLAERLSEWPGVFLEVKSKRAGLEEMRAWPNKDRIITAFSVNPETLIERWEQGADSLENRLRFARQAAEWGFLPAFHFDPILPVPGWQTLYDEAISRIHEVMGSLPIAWFSLGVLRFPKGFFAIVAENYPGTDLFFEEFYPCSDGKMRMFRPLREEVYRFLLDRLTERFPRVRSYLCMESPEVWRRLGRNEGCSGQLKKLLDGSLTGV